ncbi:MAG: adenylate/guanylate cyclase domain-containing protein [Rhodospirillaceae bacterium]|nr:adenylate/guanylate cyclase domain-containing protein [Rhodospirillaceae bacterium]
MRNRLRLISGLILFTFVLGHFTNHAMGLISLDAAERGTKIFIAPWRTLIGTIILFGAGVTHAGCAVWSLWVRRSLRLPAWELTQMILGFSAPLFLAAHLAATRGLTETSNFDSSYTTTLISLWVVLPWRGVLQAVAAIVVWTHACLGLHTWLRLKPWYLRTQAISSGIAVALPTLALAGYVAIGNEVRDRAAVFGWTTQMFDKAGYETWMAKFVGDFEARMQIGVLIVLTSVAVARVVRAGMHRIKKKSKLYYSPGNKIVELMPDATLLESIRGAAIPHASVCGGRGRCSTCRVRIGRGLDSLPAPSESESAVLTRITESPSVRLACQIRPTADIEVAALLPPDITPIQVAASTDYHQGRELTVAFLCVDLRGSTRLCEDRLPFDVVFVLNQFFAELSRALEETNGHYAQFNGDGLMAIYGLSGDPRAGAKDALRGAQAMLRRIEGLNARLEGELSEGLRIGIGIHIGEAIVGSMGPPETPLCRRWATTLTLRRAWNPKPRSLASPWSSPPLLPNSAVPILRHSRATPSPSKAASKALRSTPSITLARSRSPIRQRLLNRLIVMLAGAPEKFYLAPHNRMGRSQVV